MSLAKLGDKPFRLAPERHGRKNSVPSGYFAGASRMG